MFKKLENLKCVVQKENFIFIVKLLFYRKSLCRNPPK